MHILQQGCDLCFLRRQQQFFLANKTTVDQEIIDLSAKKKAGNKYDQHDPVDIHVDKVSVIVSHGSLAYDAITD